MKTKKISNSFLLLFLVIICFIIPVNNSICQTESETTEDAHTAINQQLYKKHVDDLQKSVDTLKGKVEQLEKDKEKLETIGISAGTLSILALAVMAWMYLKGIKNKVDEVATASAPDILKVTAPLAVNKAMEEHPVYIEIQKNKAIKNKPILILGNKERDNSLTSFLEKNGFGNTKSIAIANDLSGIIDVNDYKVFFFNNEKGELNQDIMSEVVSEYAGTIKFFYFNSTRVRWDGPEGITMSGFSNSREKLATNLFDALK